MQIYNLIVTDGGAKVDYGYYSLAALTVKLNTILAKSGNVTGRSKVITITMTTVQL